MSAYRPPVRRCALPRAQAMLCWKCAGRMHFSDARDGWDCESCDHFMSSLATEARIGGYLNLKVEWSKGFSLGLSDLLRDP